MTRDHIRDLLNTSPARALEQRRVIWQLDDAPWWRAFSRHQEHVDATKLALLEAAWQLPELLFFCPPEEPSQSELGSLLVKHGEEAWAVDRQQAPRDFYAGEVSWGNWFLYAASHPWAGEIPNTFKTSPEDLLAFMGRAQIPFFVDSLHDDDSWRVGIAPD